MITTLITGGAGFIGSQLAKELIKKKEKVVIVDNFSYGKFENLDEIIKNKENAPYYSIHCVDIRNKEILEKIFKENKFNYVYNIAGIAPLPDCQIDPQEAVQVNVGGFCNVLELSRKYGVKTVIQASTNAMYENVKNFPIGEDFSELPTLIYPNTKYCAERFAQSFCDTYGMNVCCIRFANVYGPHVDCLRKQPPFVAYMVKELYYGRTPVFHSDGNQRRDYVYVDDLIRLAYSVRSCKGFDVVNCSSGKNYSVNEMYDIAQNIMNKHIKQEYAPDKHYWEKYPELYGGAYPIKESILSAEINKYSLCKNDHAREAYGWVPTTDMETGLKKLIEAEVELLKTVKEE